MNTQRILLIIAAALFLGISITGGSGCANIIPPAGGPRDSVAPILLKASPLDSTLNFQGTRITFTFDEYVELQNVQQELLISPTPKYPPIVDYRLNTVTIRIKDSIEANTTYTYDFGNAIKDINEGNVYKNFKYTLSTGPYLDSLEFRGNVILAETGKIDTTLIVMLHSDPTDSAVVLSKPRYVTKLDNKGNFVFRNLPPRTYYVYALKDDNNTRRYFDDKNLFAFADSAVLISPSTQSVTLYAYANPAAQTASPRTAAPGQPIGRPRGGNQPDRRLRFITSLVGEQQDLLGNFTMSFEQPLRSFDSTKVSLRMDTTFTPVTGYSIVKDSTNKNLVMTNTWKENTVYHLILDKDFAEDSTGKKLLKSDTLTFGTKKLSDYGKLKIKFRNLDMAKNPVLQFLISGTITKSIPLAGPDLSVPLFFPGEYELRILFDENRNGKWDPGVFFKEHKQPELTKPIDRKIIIRPNWDNEFEIAL